MGVAECQRPNFVYVLADDLGYADLGCTGAVDAQGRAIDVSPRLDRLAREGIRFRRGYSNSPVCSPTRLALITGRWQYRIRAGAEEPLTASVAGDKVFGLPPAHPTLPSLLGKEGYRSALIGKWHLGYPPDFGPLLSGYDEFYGFHAGGTGYFSHCDARGNADLWLDDELHQEDGYLTDLLSRRAVDFIQRQVPEQPFLLSLHYSAPHWPWLARGDERESQRIGRSLKHTDGGSLHTYQQMISHMDEGIGWVLDALADKGLADNTLVIFTSDNGGERFSNNWPLTGRKMDLLEGGIRVPLIARWPSRFPGGSVCDMPNQTMDWTATMLEAAQAEPHPDFPLDGVSLMTVLAGNEVNAAHAASRDLFWRMKHRGQAALIRGKWKYLQVDGHEYLFNLDIDPAERANLVLREPRILEGLRNAWAVWNAAMPPIPADAGVSLVFGSGDIPIATF